MQRQAFSLASAVAPSNLGSCFPATHQRDKLNAKPIRYRHNHKRMTARHTILLLAVLLSLTERSTAFHVSPGQGGRPSSERGFMKGSGMVMYLPPQSPTTQTPPMSSQQILSTPGTSTRADTNRKRANSFSLSNSVLASCDTLPSFPTAHGLLSPETVMRMERKTSKSNRSPALTQFLDTYRQNGPMSCLPMLSDPSVLPHLTEALRDVV